MDISFFYLNIFHAPLIHFFFPLKTSIHYTQQFTPFQFLNFRFLKILFCVTLNSNKKSFITRIIYTSRPICMSIYIYIYIYKYKEVEIEVMSTYEKQEQ